MKKILILAFMAALTANSLWADDLTDEMKPTPTSKTPTPTIEEILPTDSAANVDKLGPHEKWIERVEGTFGFPASSDASSALNVGFGGGVAVGYRLDQHLSISAASGYYQYNIKNIPTGNSGGYFGYVPLEAVFNYTIGDESFRPYVSFGFGLAFNSYSLSTAASNGSTVQAYSYETTFMMSPAIGFLQVISPKAAIFVEGRVDMNFRSNNYLGMAQGMPSVFIPIQAGLTFFVL